MNSFKVLIRLFILELKSLFAYPATFWTGMFIIPLFALIQIAFLESIYTQTNSFLGYSRYQAYVLFASFILVTSVGRIFFYSRIAQFRGLISGNGQETFDMILLKPIDTQIFATIGRYSFEQISRLIIGGYMLYFGLSHLYVTLNLQIFLGYIYLLFLAIILFYLTFLAISLLLFFFPQLYMVEALWEVTVDLGQYPQKLYSGSLGLIFNICLPLTLMASIPTDFLLSLSEINFVLYSLIIFVTLYLTRLYFNFAINRYSSSSS